MSAILRPDFPNAPSVAGAEPAPATKCCVKCQQEMLTGATDMNMPAKYIGCDRSGIPRVWGEAKQADVAYTECLAAIREYVQRRPDTGPVSDWLIERSN